MIASQYGIGWVDGHPALPDQQRESKAVYLTFHLGDPIEGVNGISIESLLAIIEDRLQSWQLSTLKCRENALALTALQECQMWLERRTREREKRGVEGTREV